MALSREEKDALSDHYRNRDLYDPSKEQDQEVSTFQPKAMNCGGEMGYADGGGVVGDAPALNFGDLSASPSDYANASGEDAPVDPRDKPVPNPGVDALPMKIPSPQTPINRSTLPQEPVPSDHGPSVDAPVGSFNPHAGKAGWSNDPNAGAAGSPSGSGLPPDQYAQLVAALSRGPNTGQVVSGGLASLADGIMQGVARAGSPGFQKNIEETQQHQKENLANALREKYETGFKGKELAQGQERIGQEGERIKNEAAHNKATEAQSAAMLKFDQDREKINSDLEAGKISLDEAKARMEAAQKGAGLFNAIGRKLGYGPPLPGQPAAPAVRTVHTKAEWAALPKGTPYQDKNGKPGIKQ